MKILSLAYEHEGEELIGYLALPALIMDRRPGVLVMHDSRGVGGIALERIERLANMGYVAFAGDMYGGGIRYDDALAGGGAKMLALQQAPLKLRSRVIAALQALTTRAEVDPERVAAMGFCFGGQCVLELARIGADVRTVISFHGILTTAMPAAPGAVKAQVAIYCGDLDPYAPRQHVEALRDEMAAAGANWHLSVFGETYHSFTDPGVSFLTNVTGVKYCPVADSISWAGSVALLEATLGSR